MRAVLKGLDLDPDPSTLPEDPAEFSLLARMIVGPPDSPGEESFDVTVNLDQFDRRTLHAWLSASVQRFKVIRGRTSASALAAWATGSSMTIGRELVHVQRHAVSRGTTSSVAARPWQRDLPTPAC
ncbi:MAG: hypothetical protein ACRDQA_14525 [Nocardioidaceae bacterium]